MEKESAKKGDQDVKPKLLVVHNAKCMLHTSSRKHPELPFRITAILKALNKFHVL